MIALIIGVFIFILMIYYITVVLHMIGLKIFYIPAWEKGIKIRKGIIPFYYWRKKYTH